MVFSPSPTELTTGATDAVLAIECAVILVYLWRTPTIDRWRVGLWCWVFGLLAFVSMLGALAHGVEMPHSFLTAFWKLLYLSLGIIVGLFLVGSVFDWRGRAFARRIIPWSIGLGVVFYGITEVFDDSFIIFVLYETVAMMAALLIYSFLALTHRLEGAKVMATAIVLNLIAAGVQVSNLSFELLVPFDHNGVFHLIQMVANVTLGWGLRLGMKPETLRGIEK